MFFILAKHYFYYNNFFTSFSIIPLPNTLYNPSYINHDPPRIDNTVFCIAGVAVCKKKQNKKRYQFSRSITVSFLSINLQIDYNNFSTWFSIVPPKMGLYIPSKINQLPPRIDKTVVCISMVVVCIKIAMVTQITSNTTVIIHLALSLLNLELRTGRKTELNKNTSNEMAYIL